MGAGNRIRPGVSGGKGGKKPVDRYSDRVYKVLLHLRNAVDGGQVTGITDMAFLYLDREWTIEPASRIDDMRFFCLVKYDGKPRLRSDPAGQLMTTWEKRAVENQSEFAFSELVKSLMSKPRTTRPYRAPQPGDWKRIEAVRKTLTDDEKEALNLMAPSKQKLFYEDHVAFTGRASPAPHDRNGKGERL